FTPQQLGRIVRDLPQPLFQRLSTFGRSAQVAFRAGPLDRLGFFRRLLACAGMGVVFACTIRAAWRLAVVAVLCRVARLGWLRGSLVGGLAGRRFVRLRLFVGGGLLFVRIVIGRLLLILALAQRFFHQSLVVLRGSQLRLALQRLFVGVERCLQLSCLGQGVAAIVVVGGAVAPGKTFCRSGIVRGLVECLALPLRIDEVPRSLVRALGLQQTLALLIGTQPEVVELEGQAALRRQHQ